MRKGRKRRQAGIGPFINCVVSKSVIVDSLPSLVFRRADDSGILEEFQKHLVFSGRNEINCLYFCFISERIKRRCCILLPASHDTWHSMHIRTVSSHHLLSALLNWLKLVDRPFGQNNKHCTLVSVYTSQEGIECTKAK